MAKEVKKSKTVAAKKTAPKKVASKPNKKVTITFSKYALLFQAGALLISLIGLVLNLCECIKTSTMIEIFGFAVLLLAFSLLPRNLK